MHTEIRIAVLGAGNMGSALIGGMLKAGVVARDRLTATVKSESHALELAARYGVPRTCTTSRIRPLYRFEQWDLGGRTLTLTTTCSTVSEYK